MGTFQFRGFSHHVSFYLFMLTLFTCNHSSTSQDICKTTFCGMGTCQQTPTFPGYMCDCKKGWSKIELGPITSPCVIPNCTFDSGCPIPFLPPPPPKQLDDQPPTCLLCGNGTCEAKGLLDFVCHCNEGCVNLLNNPHFPCFPKCAINAKCDGFDLFGGEDPPPSPPSPPPQQSAGPGEMPNSSRELHTLTTMVLATMIFLNWI
ncbi:hypothetical protein PIB30_057485 [Stylosanthes scabra]|uniref:Uncharacterized protein n=1 Tax=Stylosanthes scabra TaxID=79078 RepID=A0ABU6UN78_9FABA|nr:hypothetical protein [Stylosanthes scabra]